MINSAVMEVVTDQITIYILLVVVMAFTMVAHKLMKYFKV